MVKTCSAVGCTKMSGKCERGISFYRFPADPEKRAKWVAAVRRENWEPKKSSWICSAHFVSGKKSEDALSPDYVPSVFSFVPSPVKRKQKILFESYERRSKRRCRSRLLPLSSEPATRTDPMPPAEGGLSATASNDRVPDVENGSDFIPPDDPASAVVDGAGEKSDVVNLQCHNTLLQEQVSKLQAENQFLCSNDVLSEESFINDDEKVKLYTGLPSYARLRATLDFVTAGLSGKQQGKLSQFSRFLLVLMKLRLNLLDADLARRFGVSPSTVSKIFTKWIHILYIRLQPLIRWPERDEMLLAVPRAFRKHFKRCVCIIDCFEVFCERPSALMARAQTYSNYKHHNTTKFLISSTPQGVISFVSRGWGGRASDKHITENCGILKKLLPGDQVMADRGFTVQESVGVYGAELLMPPFTRGKKQLAQVEVDTARQLSRVRIHVERVIGLLRNKYTILQSTLPISFLMVDGGDSNQCMLDKMVVVCSSLCNLCDSVVPLI